jgi:hypothetical protein
LDLNPVKSLIPDSDFECCMGASTPLRRRTRRPHQAGLRSGALVVALLLTSASSAVSDASEGTEATPVSTSPGAAKTGASEVARDATPSERPLRPLTRAAARSRLASVSPVDWLSRFGNVEIETQDE